MLESTGGGGVAFAVMAGVSGEAGTFAASPLSMASSWQVAPGSGEFSYSYPIDVPAPAAGSAPTVGLGYSSGAIDGLTFGSNTQATETGLGWSNFANASIERSYEPCFASGGPVHTADLCWSDDNATISLNGVSGPLVPVNAAGTEWRVESDPGWKIERLTGAVNSDIYQQQYWRVTGPDGTVYYFGVGHMPGSFTKSVLGVPVFADDPGEPCRSAGDQVGFCKQGWRWYLDRVEDPDGNVQSYLYEQETGLYEMLNGLGNNGPESYDRNAYLKQIVYGDRGWDSNNHSVRVTFGTEYRCVYLVPQCPGATNGNTNGFPDVPVDLICDTTTPCFVHAPSFFSTIRYSYVRREVRIGNTGVPEDWKPVSQENILHTFSDGADGEAKKLLLIKLQHAGTAFNGLMAYPTTDFEYLALDNRLDHAGIVVKAMRHDRLVKVKNPFGGQTTVTYGFNRQCPGGPPASPSPGPRWDNNLRDCFPQHIVYDGIELLGAFYKYLVVSAQEDPGDGGPIMAMTYTYEGDPAWAFDYNSFARGSDLQGWSRWRGYGSVTINKGSSRTRVRLFRGWNGDALLQPVGGGNFAVVHGARAVSVQTSDGQTFVDDRALAGRTLEEEQLGTVVGAANSIVQSTQYEYGDVRTAPNPQNYLFAATWVGVTKVTERLATAPGNFLQRRSTTSYNANRQPATTLEEGWLGVVGDERCSITTYADNPAKGMFVYPAINRTVAGACNSTTELKASETYYDGSTTLGAPPMRGNPTRQRTRVNATTWSETVTGFDDLGRPVEVTDPNGNVTTTTYEATAGAPATQIPIKSTVTNALGHTATTNWHPEFGIPASGIDANGNTTTFGYDAFGRTAWVRTPTEPAPTCIPGQLCQGEPGRSWEFSYDIPNRAVRSRRLISGTTSSNAVHEDTWVIYDGFWRERQTQSLSPASGKALVSETTYDDRGLLRDETVAQAQTGTPGAYIAGTSWANRTRHVYDELRREVVQEWRRGSTVAWTTTTAYAADTVTVTGPDGRQAREQVDGLGRTISAAELDGTTWVSSTYGYDLADRLVAATDPQGNQITYGYDFAGRRTSQQDPNRGSATFGYGLAGNQTGVVDALGNQVHTIYDDLNRPTERRSGSPTGTLLASWAYDGATLGKGLPWTSTTHTTGGNWVTQITAYDKRSRQLGTRLTVPAGVPGLSGQYTTTQTYNRADRVVSMTYPAMGGLAQETVTTTYNTLGLPTVLQGTDTYVRQQNYDDRGRRTVASLGPAGSLSGWMLRNRQYNDDQRLASTETSVETAGSYQVAARHNLSYSDSGNVTEKKTLLDGAEWRECFGYDNRNRLTSAYTVGASADCQTGQKGTGPNPYVDTYSYALDGRLTARTEVANPTIADVIGYTFPASGAARPHAPTKVGLVFAPPAEQDLYEWDARGNLISRTVDGQTETFSWDVQGFLSSVSGPEGMTSFVYDPSGQRRLRKTADGATMYFAGQEVTANASGSTVTAVRSYSFEGELIATRSATGVDYLVSDPAGSVEISVPSGGVPDATRAYNPYGSVRAEDGTMDTDRGFIGQVEDESTDLSYLNARYYDATIGYFVSTDPVVDTSKLKSLNPYSYSVGNPTTLSDPSGMTPGYTFGLEQQNSQLREQNKTLLGHIAQLNSHIEGLQGIIKEQQRAINDLLTHIDALEAIIWEQATIIERLQARVRYLEGVVRAQQREIGRLRAQVAAQAAWIKYLRYDVIEPLVGAAFLPFYHAGIFAAIDAGFGIPSWQGFLPDILRGSRDWLQHEVDMGTLAHDWLSAMYEGEVEESSSLREDIAALKLEVKDLEDQLDGAQWCNTLSTAGTVSSAVDVGSNVVNLIPGGQAADWGLDKFTDVADGAILAEGLRSGCVANAATNMGLP